MSRLLWGRLLRFHVLEVLIKEHGFTSGVEVGVFKGETFGYLLDHCPGLTLYGVDRDIREEARAVATKHGDRAHLVECESTTAHLRTAKDERCWWVDFAFIDADHSYESVKADIEAWKPRVRPGGILCGHDYSDKWPGVVGAVDDRFPDAAILPDKVWTVQL